MSYLKDYDKYIETERRVPRLKIEQTNIYRISTYRDRNDKVQRRSNGDNSSLIFVIGIHDSRVNCLKLNEIPTDVFFKFLKRMVVPTVKLESIESLHEGLVNSDRSGKRIFEKYVKPNKTIYNPKYNAYRSYNVDGLTYVQEVFLKPETLVKKLGIKSDVSEMIDEIEGEINE